MADPVVHITNGVPDSGTGNITTLGQTLVDGANIAIGATTDAAVTAGATGSLSAKLRSISRDLIGGIVLQAGANVIGAVTQSGSWVISAGSALIGIVKIGDGTNTATVRAGSSLPVPTDTAVVVTMRDVNGNGQATMAASSPVVIASDQSAVAVKAASGVFVAGAIADLAHGQAAMAASVPVVLASDQSAVKALPSLTATASGLTSSRVNAANSTNATSLKASAGNLGSIDVFNVAAYSVFLKFYNKASAPTVGTDTPVWTIPIPAGGGFSREFARGRNFATGIAYAITKLQADSDTTVVAVGDLTGTIDWI